MVCDKYIFKRSTITAVVSHKTACLIELKYFKVNCQITGHLEKLLEI